jgi:hypothetical protein
VGTNSPTIRTRPSLNRFLLEPQVLDLQTVSNTFTKGHNPNDARSRCQPVVREGVLEALALLKKHELNPTKTQDDLMPKSQEI